MRKMISFKIENLSLKEQQAIDDWCNQQSNVQQSLANVVMHVIALCGNTDVMDFDTQRELHKRFTAIETVEKSHLPSNVMKVPVNTPVTPTQDATASVQGVYSNLNPSDFD